MVKTIIDLPERENRILNIVKGQHGFKNKEQVFIFLIQEYAQILEPQIRPEYLKKLEKIKRGKFQKFNNKEAFVNFIENEL